MIAQANSALKAGLAILGIAAAGWLLHHAQHGGTVGQAVRAQQAIVALGRTGENALDGDALRAQLQANAESLEAWHQADRADRVAARKWSDASPRNPEACEALTMDAPVWKMRALGCLASGEYPPAILERGELVRLDDALLQAGRAPTVAGYVADYPRNEAFCSKATTSTPRLDTWRNGCVQWGVDPKIDRYPVIRLDEALQRAGIEPTTAGPIQNVEPRNTAFCDKALNTTNPLHLWRNGCLERGKFPPFVDPEMLLDDAVQHETRL